MYSPILIGKVTRNSVSVADVKVTRNSVSVADVNMKGKKVEWYIDFPSRWKEINIRESFLLDNETWRITLDRSPSNMNGTTFEVYSANMSPQFELISSVLTFGPGFFAKCRAKEMNRMHGHGPQYDLGQLFNSSQFFNELNRCIQNVCTHSVTVRLMCLFSAINSSTVHKVNVELQTDRSFCDMQNPNRKISVAAQTEEETSSDGINMLNEDIQKLYINNELCDVKIKLGPKEFLVHRAILAARSTVFSSMLNHDMIEKVAGVIDISDCDPESFEDFLKFLYSGKVENFNANFCNLYRIADKYCVDFLKNVCVDRMSKTLKVETICDVLDLASMHNETQLLKKATTFFIENAKDIFATEKWSKFVVEKTSLSSEILIKMAERTQLKKEENDNTTSNSIFLECRRSIRGCRRINRT